MFAEIVDRYCSVLIRGLVSPVQWLNAEFPLIPGVGDSDNEIIHKGMYKGQLQRLKDCYKNASEM